MYKAYEGIMNQLMQQEEDYGIFIREAHIRYGIPSRAIQKFLLLRNGGITVQANKEITH